MEITKHLRQRLRPMLLFVAVLGLTFFCSKSSDAQISLFAGGNVSSIRHDVQLENKKPMGGAHIGASIQYYPFKQLQRLSIVNEIMLIQKGYHQDFEERYSFHFNYLAFPILINYELSDPLSLQAGVELASLQSTNVEQGKETYNHFDAGLVFGLTLWGNKKLSCYSRFTYGLTPLLDYYEIDEMGNFNGELHDLKNMCLTLGLKFNLSNEKIRFFKD